MLSDYLVGQIAEWVRGVNFDAPPLGGLSLALSTTDPTADGAGLSEPPAVAGYARQPVTFSAPVVGADRVSMANDKVLTFGPVVGASWGENSHVAVFNDVGNMLWSGEIDRARERPLGDTLTFAVGALQIDIGPFFSAYFATAVLEWMRGVPMPSAPLGVLAGLSIADPSFDGSGLNESSLAGYQRLVAPFDYSGRTLANSSALIFGPAISDWGSVTFGTVFSDGGDLLFSGPIAAPEDVDSGDTFAVPAGAYAMQIR
ncbi:hypothetical protein [Tateyamaria sp. ANG-S1]|uniref:phage tail fiber protein n=1 Tax=Tateyamaria sp. ANG-S1 TaxID=1577905 RepID=UPI00057F23C9|nr:hypothetical protein [Tateyamaria sp. ANG-S1]KIC48387.1 hypothetical protein RA29_11455 [Tateyamaria sp. ANG-S1]